MGSPNGVEVSVAMEACPDGGVVAWLQVAASFTLFFNNWGIVNSFGVFQTFYETGSLIDNSPDEIAWIGSIQSFLLLLVGAVAGPLYDMGYLRALVIAGTGLISLGFMLTSISTQYWHLLLSQAFVIGMGTGFLCLPSLALIPQYFSKKRAIAIALVTSGSSLGGTIYPLIFQALLPKVGFPWTTRCLGFISLGSCSLALTVLRPRGKPSTRRSLVDKKAFRDIPYLLYCGAMCSSYIGFFVPVFYIQPFALSAGHMSNKNLALHLVAILNAASVPGRLVPAYIASLVGPITTMLGSAVLCFITCLCWIAVHNAAGTVAFTVAYGIVSGGFISIPAVVLTSLTPDMSRLGTRMGMSATLNGLGSLCGAPLAGVILNHTNNYFGVQLFSGLAISVTAVFLLLLRISTTERKVYTKA